ncbi:hypothetical protein FF38_03808 [Lucilia cuprina]|uniref:MADF domain-containing protein n=1 Tax=Lucilia cuprina TaxID=7375 RepID=A0A0L0CKF2_LUCCU|nr:hypothetical protein FF38_03808 [Lucilia cuprina]
MDTTSKFFNEYFSATINFFIRFSKQIFWNRKMIETFIELYKENVCLYDTSHENYNNQTVKMHALKNIVQRMKQYLPNIELKDVQDKIKAIRTQLISEISLIEEAEASGNKYEPNLWCFEQLEFLRDHLTADSSKKENDTKEEPIFYEEIQNENADYQSDASEVSLYTELNAKKKRGKIERRFKWERESLILFIKQLERYRVLYDPKHKDYSKQQIRYAAYNKLLRIMKNLHPEITLTEIRGKIRCIRNQYLKELHSLKNAQKRNESYTPKLWCYDLLDNLYRDVKPKTPRFKRNIDDMNDTSQVSNESFNIDNTTSNELLEFEEIHHEIENEEDYEKESVNIEAMGFTQNNDTTIDYECVNTFEYNTEDVQPTKKRCLPKDYCDNVMDFNEITKFEITENHMKQEKNKRTTTNVDKDAKYDWLGELVVSQMSEISRKYHTEFAWDVQCLIRKYIVKSKTGDGETSALNTSDDTTNANSKPSTSRNIVLPRTSNVSFNLSFV